MIKNLVSPKERFLGPPPPTSILYMTNIFNTVNIVSFELFQGWPLGQFLGRTLRLREARGLSVAAQRG